MGRALRILRSPGYPGRLRGSLCLRAYCKLSKELIELNEGLDNLQKELRKLLEKEPSKLSKELKKHNQE